MRLTRKLMLLAVTAIAAMAMSAASASALSVQTESTGKACPSVGKASHGTGSGGCIVHATSVGTVELGAFGTMITCNNEFSGRTNSNGVGYIDSMSLTNCSSPVTPCSEAAGNDVWPSQLNGENSQEANFCVNTAFGNVQCTIENLVVSDGGAGHSGGSVRTPGSGHQDCDEFNTATLSGVWNFETSQTPELEIVD